MSLLDLRNVSAKLGGLPVLDDITLHVAEGEFVSILGPSGAGKSTIFRLLTSALPLQEGRITSAGRTLEDSRNSFAFMPQRDALMPWRRIIDNLTLGLEVQGMPRRQARAKITPLLADFGLEGFTDHYPAQLSGGMRQRAALLRTVVQGRAVQLLDEPFGALDALTRTQMQTWFETRWQAASWTILLVTHDVREAVALSDRIYVLSPRPARIVAEIPVPIPRPRLGRAPSTEAIAIERQLLDILLHQTGDTP
ncbi:MAG: ABC transporter ATP-binding protein [Pseudomonadota bacterium]